MGASTIHESRPDASMAEVPDPPSPEAFPAEHGRWRGIDITVLVVVGIISFVVRFWTRSPMWLDEALTVDIARHPLGQIPGALRHDGHPPLYYFALHLWMSVFGESDRAVRALPGIFGVLAVPAGFAVGRRIGGRTVAWCVAVVLAVSPFAIRYSTENRMYSLVMVLALVGWLCADRVLSRPRPVPVIGLALCTGALLWTQYWGLWLGAVAASMLLWRLRAALGDGRRERARATLWALGALAAGAISFLPWLPTMLYQGAHTGTPWATRSLPPTVVVTTIETLGGTGNTTTEIGGWIVAVAIALGLFGLGVASGRIDLDLRVRTWARPFAWLAGGTWVVGVLVAIVTNSAFQPRYNAVWLPFAFVLAGVGVALLRGPLLQRGALALVVLASISGIYQNIDTPRTRAVEVAAAIEAKGRPGDVVAVCPDQLGPSLVRVLPTGFDVGTFPDFGDPQTVDWVDYMEHTRSVEAGDFAEALVARAGPERSIFVLWSDQYLTHEEVCRDIVVDLGRRRPDNRQILKADGSFFESGQLNVFRPDPDR